MLTQIIGWTALPVGAALSTTQGVWTLAAHTYTRFPIDCGAQPLQMLETLSVAPVAGTNRLLVLVQCSGSDGFGTTELLVYRGQLLGSGSPKPAEILVAPNSGWYSSPYVVSQMYSAAANGDIKFPVCGYSNASVPRSLPNVFTTLSWRWTGKDFAIDAKVPKHLTGVS